MVFINHYSELDWDGMFHDSIIVIPILSDHERHRCLNRISFVYIYNLVRNEEYVIGCHHNDVHQNGEDWIGIVKWPKHVFCYKKNILHKFNVRCWDVDMCYWLQNNIAIPIELSVDITTYYRWYWSVHNINDIIPIVTFITHCQNIVQNFKDCIFDIEFDTVLEFYSSTVLTNLCLIENSGIPCDTQAVRTHFNKCATVLYSEYYPYTSTGRPSNRFGGINFAALEKASGARSIINVNSDSEMLIEFDYDSYHVRLVANLIGYELPEGNIHQYFGRQYFNTPILTEEQYNQSKAITFRMLYGNIYPEYKNINFFRLVHDFRRKLWAKFNTDGFVYAPLSKRKIYSKNFEDMSSNKLFNYMLQGYETDVNNVMLYKVLGYLYNKKSKLILYTYDSFLFVYNKDDGKTFIDDVRGILDNYGMHTNLKIGWNYNNMKSK